METSIDSGTPYIPNRDTPAKPVTRRGYVNDHTDISKSASYFQVESIGISNSAENDPDHRSLSMT